MNKKLLNLDASDLIRLEQSITPYEFVYEFNGIPPHIIIEECILQLAGNHWSGLAQVIALLKAEGFDSRKHSIIRDKDLAAAAYERIRMAFMRAYYAQNQSSASQSEADERAQMLKMILKMCADE